LIGLSGTERTDHAVLSSETGAWLMSAKFFDPEGLTRVGNMDVVAREVVEGFLSGRHRSPYQGFSVEFMDHRPYTQTDEIRTLDWKLLARTDRYYVKLFQDETNLRAHILLDASRSMAYGEPGKTKLEYAAFLTAALSYLLLRQNDALGFAFFDRQVRHYLPPLAKASQFRRVLDALENVTARGETRIGDILHSIAERISRRGLVILISDLLDDPAHIADGLQHLRHDHHEVIVFHVMHPDEITFPYDRMARFRDMEGAGQIIANPRSARRRYLERMDAFTERIRAECFRRKISYTLAETNRPYDTVLAEYLEKRSRMH